MASLSSTKIGGEHNSLPKFLTPNLHATVSKGGAMAPPPSSLLGSHCHVAVVVFLCSSHFLVPLVRTLLMGTSLMRLITSVISTAAHPKPGMERGDPRLFNGFRLAMYHGLLPS